MYQSLALVGGSVIGGAITGASVTWGIPEGGEIGIVGAVIGVVIFVVGFFFFRHGSEVTEGDIEKPYFKPMKGVMNKMGEMGGR